MNDDSREAILARTAALVREAYITHYRMVCQRPDYGKYGCGTWDGGEDAYGVRRPPVWEKIAEFILEHGVDPMQFVRSQFVCGNTRAAPRPNTLYSPEALARYKKYTPDAEVRARRKLETGARSVVGQAEMIVETLGWDRRAAMLNALQDTLTVQASPLVRFCLAAREGFEDLKQALRRDALMEYVCETDALDRTWGELIPAELRELARTSYGRNQ